MDGSAPELLAEQGIDGATALTGAFGCYRLELPEGTWVDVVEAEHAAQEADVYERCRRLLAEELGAYPSPETESMYRELLDAPPALPRPTASEPSRDSAQGGAPARLGRKRFAIALACGAAILAVAVGAAFVLGGLSGDLPSVLTVAPTQGPAGGGSLVEIVGSRFTDATEVHFGRLRAAFVVNNDSSITAISPHRGAGTVDVTVTSAGGTSTTGAQDQITYTRL